MSSETVTREDLKQILNKVLPISIVEMPSVVGVGFEQTITSTATGGKTASATISIPEGYEVVPNCRPLSVFVSGDPRAYITDRGTVTINGSTVSFSYYLYNPASSSNLILLATILCRKVKDGSLKSDYIVEEGASGIWTYRKWSSGVSECWGIVSKTTSYAVWTSPIYYGTTYTGNQAYPTDLFISEPSVTATLQHGGGADLWLGMDSQNPGNETRSPSWYPLSVNTSGSSAYKVGVHAKGRWKQ